MAGMLPNIAQMRDRHEDYENVAPARPKFGRRDFLRACLAAGALPWLSACERAKGPPIRVGTNTWTGYEPMHVAHALGLLPEGSVHLARMASASSVLTGLMAGQFDAAGVTLDELLSAREDGLDLRVVAVLDVSNGADCVLARPGLEGADSLRGRTVVVEKSAVGALLLDAFLRHVGLTTTDVQMSYLPVDGHVAAWASGWADVVVTFDPASIAIESSGGVRLFDSSMIPGRIVDVLAAVAPCSDHCRESLARLLAGHFRVLDRLAEGVEDVQDRLARGLGLEVPELRDALARLELPDLEANRRWLAGNPPPIEETADMLAAVMTQAGLLKAPPSGPIADPSVLAQVRVA